jgi:hypothetical protein
LLQPLPMLAVVGSHLLQRNNLLVPIRFQLTRYGLYLALLIEFNIKFTSWRIIGALEIWPQLLFVKNNLNHVAKKSRWVVEKEKMSKTNVSRLAVNWVKQLYIYVNKIINTLKLPVYCEEYTL